MGYIIQQAGEAFQRNHYSADAIFFFDFDGVLATQCEEKVFRLPEEDMERRRLEEKAPFAGVDSSLYPNIGYLRHLVFQGYAWGTVPEPHDEATSFARSLTENGDPYFIVTARSGLWAVRRLLDFAEQQFIFPQEVFCLGRASKALLLAELRKDWPDRPFVFFEDSQHHIDACRALADPLLEIVKIEWDSCTKNAEALRDQFLGPVM
jgi:hypothetical protein